MSRRITRGRYGLAALAVSLTCVPAAMLAPSAAADAGGSSSFCDQAGAPSSSKTIAVPGVLHVTVFTCGDAKPPAFQQCMSRTIDVPNALHVKVYDCLPPQVTSPPAPPTVPFTS